MLYYEASTSDVQNDVKPWQSFEAFARDIQLNYHLWVQSRKEFQQKELLCAKYAKPLKLDSLRKSLLKTLKITCDTNLKSKKEWKLNGLHLHQVCNDKSIKVAFVQSKETETATFGRLIKSGKPYTHLGVHRYHLLWRWTYDNCTVTASNKLEHQARTQKTGGPKVQELHQASCTSWWADAAGNQRCYHFEYHGTKVTLCFAAAIASMLPCWTFW